jgi:uncharacterized repeat protein (TIGR03803 family)
MRNRASLLVVSVVGFMSVAAAPAPTLGSGQSEQVLYSFQGASDGAAPNAGVLFDRSGNIFGTTSAGGQACSLGSAGCGVAFVLRPSASGTYQESVLYRFAGGVDGAQPTPGSGLVADAAGALYGTTVYGGQLGPSAAACGGTGCGTIFRLTPTASGYVENVLYRFRGGRDGSHPQAGLIEDASGAFFGTTADGGGSVNCPSGCGTVFELRRSGSGYAERILHRFAGSTGDGSDPLSGLVRDRHGNLFGTTYAGGQSDEYEFCDSGCGTAYELKRLPRRFSESVLVNFLGFTQDDGSNPIGGLTISPFDGLLYGTTSTGVAGAGTIWVLVPSQGELTLWAFGWAGPSGGQFPTSTMIPVGLHSFYGTTPQGGTGQGTVYEMVIDGGVTIVHTFGGPGDGITPYAQLVAENGQVYGTTMGGGTATCSCGTVYSLATSNP